MDLKLFDHKGVPLERQRFTWRELVQKPISKLDDDAFTRVRIILVNGIEADALRFKHLCARRDLELRLPLANIRRSEQHQATMVNWLIGADHSPLEMTIAYEQAAVEVTASVAQNEPDAGMAEVYRFGVLEELDHLYRYSALLDRLEGKDSNNILQGYTDVAPGRPTTVEHRAPHNDLRNPYTLDAAPLTKIHATMITAAAHQTHSYYMNIGPYFADPLARLLYAEIASIEEQHVTQYGSLINPDESWLEHWLVHEAMEAYAYHSCMEEETNPRIRAIWERFLDYELGHFHAVARLMQVEGKRDPEAIFGAALDRRIDFKPQRDFYRAVLEAEVDVGAKGVAFVPPAIEHEASIEYRSHLNSAGSPSSVVAAGYRWAPGMELVRKVANICPGGQSGRTAASEQSPPIARPGEEAAVWQLRAEYALEADALGSVPPPGTLRGVQTGFAKPIEKNPEVLVDKIGERLAHERSAVRMYEAFMVKCRVHPSGVSSIPLDELEEICAAKARHFKLLADVLITLGIDPTAQSPGADANGIFFIGATQLLSDPRTSLAQALTGLLTVELADNAAWELLIQLAEQAGQNRTATQFAAALEEEQRHLELVRPWLRRELLGHTPTAAHEMTASPRPR